MRGIGAIELVREILPEGAVSVFRLVTHLGDVGLFFVLLSVLYWSSNHDWVWARSGDERGGFDRGAYVLGLALGGLALGLLLKTVFALPRPPASLQVTLADGYGFPSGHAVGSTVVWGLLAATLGVGTRRQRTGIAAVVVALVALSRVVLGVHFAVDVIVGVAVGLAYLAVAMQVTNGEPDRAFGLAAVVAGGALVLSVVNQDPVTTRDAVTSIGGTLGALLTWRLIDVPLRWRSRTAGFTAVLVGLPLFGALKLGSTLLDPSLGLVLVANALIPSGILALPAVVELFDAKETGQSATAEKN